jgi:peptide-methionine (S)-S-oxide reductase
MRFLLPIMAAGLAACGGGDAASSDDTPAKTDAEATLLVAGGCFWCVEADLEKLDGVGDVISGYAGGTGEPTYKTYDALGHREVALVPYDPDTISFEELVGFFLRTVDVTDEGGQFCDRGYGYSTAVYFSDDDERRILEQLIVEGEEEIGQEIVTPVEERPRFTPAEAYHQDYYKKNTFRYGTYRRLCGRDRTVKDVWGQSAPERLEARS